MHKSKVSVGMPLTPTGSRKEKQLRRKEAKAEVAAQLEASIEKELLARLQVGRWAQGGGGGGPWGGGGRAGDLDPRKELLARLLALLQALTRWLHTSHSWPRRARHRWACGHQGASLV